MTDRNTGTNRSPLNLTGVLRWKNVSAETVPAFGVVKLTAYNAVGRYYDADKPDGEGTLYFLNGPVPVAVNSYGESKLWGDASQLGKVATGIVFGDEVGPVDASWEMDAGSGWVVFSEPSGGVAALLRNASGGAQADIQFRPLDVCEGIGSTCDCVSAEVLKVTCGGTGVAVGDTVSVWDPGQSFFDMPSDLLFNSSGWAHKVALSQAERDALPTDPGPCRWEVYVMDCVEDTP